MNNLKFLLSVLTLFVSVTARAESEGGHGGNGGIGILCGNKLQTLDIYEGTIKAKFPAPKSAGDLDANLEKYGTLIVRHLTESASDYKIPNLSKLMAEELRKSIINKFYDLPIGERLHFTHDASLPKLPKKCSPVQIAVYARDGKIYRDRQYWDMLDSVQQAALVIHEWIYERARYYGALNSDETRRVVAGLFAEVYIKPILSPIWNAKRKLSCVAGIQGSTKEVFEFYAVEGVRKGRAGVGIYFRGHKDVYVTSRTSAFIYDATLDQIASGKLVLSSAIVTNDVMGKVWKMEISSMNGLKIRSFTQGQQAPPFSSGFCQFEN